MGTDPVYSVHLSYEITLDPRCAGRGCVLCTATIRLVIRVGRLQIVVVQAALARWVVVYRTGAWLAIR